MIKPKPEIARISPVYHGAFDYEELARWGFTADELLDFSVNSNPYGPPLGVREAIQRVPLDRYPDRECLALRQKLAERHEVEPENIVVGNGTAELLHLIAFAFLERRAKVMIPAVTFGEYARVAQLIGATVQLLPPSATKPNQFHSAEMEVSEARLVFFCNPNNPDGAYLSPDWIGRQWAAKHPHTLFVIDEAYTQFLPEPYSVIATNQPNVLAVRSLTKDYALAGLRLGYVVGPLDLIEAVRRVRPAWNVNALAQAAGVAVLDQATWLRETVAQLHENKRELEAGLRQMGLLPQPSAVHYFLVNVGNGAQFRAKLLQHKVMVRDCASFGLPDYVRIATRTPADNQRLLVAIKNSL